MSLKFPRIDLYSEELRTGCLGVPLSLAQEVYRRCVINRETALQVGPELSLSIEVCRRMACMMKRCGLPTVERLIVLSLGYPDRSPEDVAAAFAVTVEDVLACRDNADQIRSAEPLPSELWEDITRRDMSPAEIQERAEQKKRHGMEQKRLSGRSRKGPPSRARVGRSATRRGAGVGARRQAGHGGT